MSFAAAFLAACCCGEGSGGVRRTLEAAGAQHQSADQPEAVETQGKGQSF